MRSSHALALALLALAPLAAPGTVAAAGGAPIDDRRVAQAVRRALRTDVELWGSVLRVVSRDGIVQLAGQARTARARLWAARRALGTGGVRAVINGIALAPARRSDDELRQSLKTALDHELGGERVQLAADVQQGQARLRGRVGSLQQRLRAWWAALGVAGVRLVRDELRVEHEASRPDEDLARDIRFRLARDPFFDAAFVWVAVSGGRVRLRGAVRSSAERARIVRQAHVRGARSVADELELSSSWTAEHAQRTRPPLREAAAVQDAVRLALATDRRVRNTSVALRAEGATLVLRTAGGGDVRCAIEEDAWNTAGVVGVRLEPASAERAAPAAAGEHERDAAGASAAACAAASYLRLAAGG